MIRNTHIYCSTNSKHAVSVLVQSVQNISQSMGYVGHQYIFCSYPKTTISNGCRLSISITGVWEALPLPLPHLLTHVVEYSLVKPNRPHHHLLSLRVLIVKFVFLFCTQSNLTILNDIILLLQVKLGLY